MKGDRLGELEELTMLAVAGLASEAYGVAVQQLLEKEMRREVSMGAVYAALERMERKGFLSSSLGESTAARGGKRKRLFVLTPLGQRTLREVRRTREALWSAAAASIRGRS
jgi:DNA-binding PadR family transcriptional regulator